MQGREKLLIAITVGVILLWQGMPFYNRIFVEPIAARNADLLRLEDELTERERTQHQIRRAHSNLVVWQQKSLPADTLNAQRLYLEWLTDMASLSGFSDLKVTPPKTTARAGKIYTPIQVKIDGKGTYEQLCRFLDRVDKGELLQRIAEMDIKVPKEGQKDKLTISLTAEGLIVKGSQKHDQLLPRTELREQVSQSATTFNVASAEQFPKQAPFLVRSGTEIIKVTTASEAAWTVERAAESTSAADHAKGDMVELFHIIPKKPVAEPDLKLVVAGNLFAKPSVKSGPTDPLDGEYAKNTWLRALWSVGDEWEGRIYDAQSKMKILRKGSTFEIDGVKATVAEIHPDYLMVQFGDGTKRLNLGSNLQSMKGDRPSGATSQPAAESDGAGRRGFGRGGGEGRGRGRQGGDRRPRNFDPNDPRIKEFREKMKRGDFGDAEKMRNEFRKRMQSGNTESDSKSESTDGSSSGIDASAPSPSDSKK